MKNNSGQVLIEAIVAIAVVAFVLAGIVTALIASVNNSTFSKNQNLATNFAQEGLDLIRDQKESDFVLFSTLGTGDSYCLGPNATSISIDSMVCQEDDVVGGIFTRNIYVDSSGAEPSCGAPGIYVSSIVSWNDSRCDGSSPCHKVELDSCFLDLGESDI